MNAPAVAPGVNTLAVCTGELETGCLLDGRARVGTPVGGGGPPMGGGPPGGSPILGTLVGCGGCGGGPPRLGGMAELGIKRGLEGFGVRAGDEYLDDEAELGPGV